MGGGNLLAFFDFPDHGDAPVVRGIGAMHHVALKAVPEQYKALFARLKKQRIEYDVHGTEEAGSVYFRDPDNALIEITCR
jgi:catechol 2,3-dioxygenase-like lactoylglutathione lyase family enzyme